MSSSKTICCGCNVYILAKILTFLEFLCLVVFVIIMYDKIAITLLLAICFSWIAYLSTEYAGIHMKKTGLIIFGCIFRICMSLVYGIAIVFVYLYTICHFIECDNFSSKHRTLLENRYSSQYSPNSEKSVVWGSVCLKV